MNRDETVAALRRLESELDVALSGLSDDLLRARPADGGWSVLEVCCHLRDAAAIEHERLGRIAREDDPVIEPYDQAAMAVDRRYNEEDVDAVRAELAAWWERLAVLLTALPEDAWQRTARHTERGTITLGWRAQRQVEHPREHFEQMRSARAVV